MKFCPGLISVLALLALATGTAGIVVINEMEVNPPDGGLEWVELYNSGNDTVDVSGWRISIEDGSWRGDITMPPGTIIAPKEFAVGFGQRGWNHSGSGKAFLFDASGQKVDETGSRSDYFDNDMTYGRYPDGRDTDKDGDWGLMMGSQGRPNQVGKS